jgi:histidine ammonia-lyase
VVAIELLAACQALETLRPLKSSPALEKIRSEIAAITPPRREDAPFTTDVELLAAWLRHREPAPG